MIASSRTYAIGMVHFQLGGGWLVTGILLGIYTLCFAGAVALYYYAQYLDQLHGGGGMGRMGPGPSDLARLIMGFVMALQGLALLLVGGYRVSNSIRLDVSSRMMESHRLMPVTSSRAVMGYIFGPPTPAIAFVLLNLLLSCCFGLAIGAPFDRLLVNQLIIFAFAVFAWSFIALGTFIYRHVFFIGLGVIVLSFCCSASSGSYAALPGLAMLMTPFAGESVFIVFGGFGVRSDPPYMLYAMGFAGQAILFLLFFFASCRLYRGTFITAFSSRQALLLLGTWALLSAAGISNSGEFTLSRLFRGGFMGGAEYDERLGTLQVVASLAACILVALIPLWSLIQEERVKPQSPVVHGVVLMVVAVIASLPVVGASWMAAYKVPNFGVTVLVMCTQVIVMYCALRLLRSMRFLLALLVMVAGLLAINLGPVILETLRVMAMDRNSFEGSSSVLITFSPLGLLTDVWGDTRDVSLVYGIAWQLVLAMTMMFLTYVVGRRGSKGAGGIPGKVLPVMEAMVPDVEGQ